MFFVGILCCSCQHSTSDNDIPTILFSNFYTHYDDTINQVQLPSHYDSVAQKNVIGAINFGDTVTFSIALFSATHSLVSCRVEWDTLALWMMIDDERRLSPLLADSTGQNRGYFNFLPGYGIVSFNVRYTLRQDTMNSPLPMEEEEGGINSRLKARASNMDKGSYSHLFVSTPINRENSDWGDGHIDSCLKARASNMDKGSYSHLFVSTPINRENSDVEQRATDFTVTLTIDREQNNSNQVVFSQLFPPANPK